MSAPDPYQLIGHDPAEAGLPDTATLKKARRRILARFELSGETEIEINGVRTDKNSALKALDMLENPDTAARLAALKTDPLVRGLMDNPDIRDFDRALQSGALDPTQMPPELALALAEAGDRELVIHWKAAEFAETERLAGILNQLPDSVVERAWRGMRIALTDLCGVVEEEAERMKDAQYAVARRRAMTKFGNQGLIKLLNGFPPSMARHRDSYADSLMQLITTMFNSGMAQAEAVYLVKGLNELKVSRMVREKVVHMYNHLVVPGTSGSFRQGFSKKTHSTGNVNTYKIFAIAFGIILFVALLLSMCRTVKDQNPSDPESNPARSAGKTYILPPVPPQT